MKRTLLLTAALLTGLWGISQGLYESAEIKKAYEKNTRSRDGVPGINYWQNTIRYDLKAELDPSGKLLTGSGDIWYTNNSPDSLRYMVIKLLPHVSKKGSARDYGVAADQLNDGMVIENIAINGEPQDIGNTRMFREYGTNLYVIFNRNEKLAPGAEINFSIDWNYTLILHGIRNGAFTDSAFFVGYWYPQIAVYDDVYGWDRESYTGKQETYNDLGTYHVELSVPEDYLVWATGDQLNEKDIFSEETLEKIAQSRKSDQSIRIVSPDSYANNTIFKKGHPATWIFEASNVPDFAWACSNYYNWDANTLKLKDAGHDEVWINVAYPDDAQSFSKVADVAHQSIDYLSHVFPGIAYPFNKHITFNGINHVAVEYPMMANNSDHSPEEMYTELTIHEIAHNYIPFYMLANERKHAWIDEGWVKLIGEKHGEDALGILREDKQALNTIKVYERFAGTSNDLPLIVPSGFMTTTHNFYHSYAKASNANAFLLELMHEKGVENPLKEYLLAWKGKHPSPYDFFYFMNALCGEDLSWFWKPWYFEFSAPDQELLVENNGEKVLVKNKGGIPMPVMLSIQYANDHETMIEKSIWSWAGGDEAISIDIPDHENVKSIRLGSPAIPDIDRSNNMIEPDSQLSE